MKNDPLFEQLREACWRGKLSAAEEAQLRSWMAAHPEAHELELEMALNQSLDRLANVAVPSNFTNRVVEAARLESAAEQGRSPRSPGGWLRRIGWIPKIGFAAALAAGLFVTYHQVHQAHLTQIRQSLMTVAAVPPEILQPEVLQDFDTIRALSQTPAADEDLIRLLQ